MWAGWRERLSLIVYWFHLGLRNFKSVKPQTLFCEERIAKVTGKLECDPSSFAARDRLLQLAQNKFNGPGTMGMPKCS